MRIPFKTYSCAMTQVKSSISLYLIRIASSMVFLTIESMETGLLIGELILTGKPWSCLISTTGVLDTENSENLGCLFLISFNCLSYFIAFIPLWVYVWYNTIWTVHQQFTYYYFDSFCVLHCGILILVYSIIHMQHSILKSNPRVNCWL